MGIILSLFFIIMAFSGFSLAWKKNSGELLMAKTANGMSNNPNQWLSIDSLVNIASKTVPNEELDKVDLRPAKGVGKFIFIPSQKEIQLDLKTGQIMSNSTRYSDWFEKIHDGSIVSDEFKLFYSSLLGISLFLFCLTGLWMYLEPKQLKKLKRNR